jgi:hypothetical protein
MHTAIRDQVAIYFADMINRLCDRASRLLTDSRADDDLFDP